MKHVYPWQLYQISVCLSFPLKCQVSLSSYIYHPIWGYSLLSYAMLHGEGTFGWGVWLPARVATWAILTRTFIRHKRHTHFKFVVELTWNEALSWVINPEHYTSTSLNRIPQQLLVLCVKKELTTLHFFSDSKLKIMLKIVIQKNYCLFFFYGEWKKAINTIAELSWLCIHVSND